MAFKQKFDTNKIAQRLHEEANEGKVPEGTYTKIAKEFGTSRQRVQQIARSNNIAGPRENSIKNPQGRCKRCNRLLQRGNKSGYCSCNQDTNKWKVNVNV